MTSVHTAWRRMRHLAELLRAGQPIPADLAAFVADAIEAVEGKPITDARKAKAFTDELELTARNRRKLDLTPEEAQIERNFSVPSDGYPSQTKAAKHISKALGLSESTVINRLREAEKLQQGV